MNANINHIKEFLTYQLSKAGASDTDRLVFLLLVLEPQLFNKAIQWIFPEKNATVTNETPGALQRFVKANAALLALPGAVSIDPDKVDYTAAVNALFL